MAYVSIRSFASHRLQWINQAARVLLVDTSISGTRVKVPLPRLNKKPATLLLDPAAASVKEALQDFAYSYGVPLRLRSSEGAVLSATTPIADLLKEPFFIEFGGTLYSVLPTNYDPSKLPLSQEMKVAAEQYMIERGLSESTAGYLASFNVTFLNELKDRETVSKDFLTVLANKVLTARSLIKEYHEDYHMAYYTIFKEQHARELALMDTIEKRAKLSADRWCRSFWQVLLTQFFFTQYGTYYLYSWDIMEPITCMMTMGDTAIGYYFWIFTRGFKYESGGIWDYFYQRKKAILCRRNKLNPTEMAHIQSMLGKLLSSTIANP